MSIPNPLVINFGLQAADSDHPINLDFEIQNRDVNVPFALSHSIRPIIRTDTYIHHQDRASDTWEIHHTLHKWPSVTIVDSAKTVVVGCIQYIDEDYIILTFSQPFSGTAYLN